MFLDQAFLSVPCAIAPARGSGPLTWVPATDPHCPLGLQPLPAIPTMVEGSKHSSDHLTFQSHSKNSAPTPTSRGALEDFHKIKPSLPSHGCLSSSHFRYPSPAPNMLAFLRLYHVCPCTFHLQNYSSAYNENNFGTLSVCLALC